MMQSVEVLLKTEISMAVVVATMMAAFCIACLVDLWRH